MKTESDGGEVFEDEAGVFVGQRKVEVGAKSNLGGSELQEFVVLDHKEGFIEAEVVLLPEDSLYR